MSDNRVSLLVKNQLPDFIIEDHPRFLSFMEAYYEFLDNSSYGKAKDIRDISDVDIHIDEFEQQFLNSFIPYIPRDTQINKDFIIKNIMPLYLSKGSEKSFKYLFRLLFDEEAELSYPGKSVLRASDAKWISENILRAVDSVHSSYVSDGIRVLYYLPELYELEDFEVYVDDVLTNDYAFYRETQKLIFNTPPSDNSIIKIYYNNFNISILSNREVIGINSGATALIEKTGIRKLYGSVYYELLINAKTLLGTFESGERIVTNIRFNDTNINFFLNTFSDLDKITIIDGGSSYNIGDPVIIRGSSTREAIAVVDKVTTGRIEDLILVNGGAGFKVDANIVAVGYEVSSFDCDVKTIDTSGIYSSNTITYNSDVIANFSGTLINAPNYGFSSPISENVNTRLIDAFGSQSIANLGIITSFNVNSSVITSTLNPSFDATPEKLIGNFSVKDLGTIGRIDILDAGSSYLKNDVIQFTNEGFFSGQGAVAYVNSVNVHGSITSIRIVSGGVNYNANFFPKAEVISNTGINAVVRVAAIMGDGEILLPLLANTVAGKILSIKIVDHGVGYTTNPGIDLSTYGAGDATANSTIRSSYIKLDGRWKTSEGLLSTEDIVLQGRDYYIDYSYVTSAQVEFYKYKSILKNLLHPVGLINYARYQINRVIDANTSINVSSTITIVPL
jgi:hypothetical protein